MSTTEDAATDTEYSAEYWIEQLDHAKKMADTWETLGVKVVQRYRDERNNAVTAMAASKFNILWSNVQVLRPSLYGRVAKPEVSRRYRDADPVARLASTMLERVLEYETTQFPDFDAAMTGAVEDRLLPGRGTVWLRFDPLIVADETEGEQVTSVEEEPESEHIKSAHAPVEYVYWKDFRHSPARVWNEVWWVARAVYMTADEGNERFGEIFDEVPLHAYKEDNAKNPKDRADQTEFAEKGKVWEIWDKRTGRVCWVGEGFNEILDEIDDPLHLEGFFPCPKPLYATTTNGSLIPVPDYVEYQDQARELDDITGRLTMMVKAVKANGVYNGEFKEIGRLLQETTDNTLVPVGNWGNLSEKGGLKGAIDMMDISATIQAITVLDNQRTSIIQTIYEISGISDVMRGSTKAEETLGAQQLKANFAGLRLKPSQADVARFASDIFRLKAQIICQFYPPQLIVKMSGISETADGQNPEMLMAAVQMLSQATVRDFHICVESDSLAQIDDDAEKAAATEAITAIGAFLEKALPAVQSAPQLLPMISEMLLFLTRRFRAGRSLEAAIEQAMKQLQAAAAQPKGPTPEQIDAQMQQQADAARIAADTQAAQMKEQFAAQAQTAKLQAEGQLEQQKMQMEIQKSKMQAQIDGAIEARKQYFELEQTKMENQTKILIADKDNDTKIRIAEMDIAAKKEIAATSAAVTVGTQQQQIAADAESTDKQISADSEMADKSAEAETASKKMDQQHETKMAKMEKSESDEPAPYALKDPKKPAAAIQLEMPEPPKEEPKKPRAFKIIRGSDGRMSGVVEVEEGALA